MAREAVRRIFLYEYVTGGGFFSNAPADAPGGSLLAEGRAMVTALLEDLASCRGWEAVGMWDERLPRPPLAERFHGIGSEREHDRLFERLASEADFTLLIAPEFDGILETLCGRASARGARLLSPPLDFVRLASRKDRACQALRMGGIAVPEPVNAWPPPAEAFPLVRKPVDGAGSLAIRVFHSLEDWRDVVCLDGEAAGVARDASTDPGEPAEPARWYLERYVPGTAASVAVLHGPRGRLALPACRQLLTDDGTFRYLGGALPLPEELRERAGRLAHAALSVLPAALGYVGVDLVLGDSADGSGDVVVEVNPRLTTSYVGLRRALPINLAAAMLAVARGETVELPRDIRPVQFEPDGTAH